MTAQVKSLRAGTKLQGHRATRAVRRRRGPRNRATDPLNWRFGVGCLGLGAIVGLIAGISGRAKGRLRWWIKMCMWPLAVYVLSIGPCAGLLFLIWGQRVAWTVYLPILAIGHYWRPFVNVLEKYQNLWWGHPSCLSHP